MIPKQWFEEQGEIEIKDTIYHTSNTFSLYKRGRTITITEEKVEHNEVITFNVKISFIENDKLLAFYNYINYDTNLIKELINSWLTHTTDLIDFIKTYDNTVCFMEDYGYYVKYGADGKKVYAWELLMSEIEKNTDISDLCALMVNSTVYNFFIPFLNDNNISFFWENAYARYFYKIEKKDKTYIVLKDIAYNDEFNITMKYETQNQEFPTPHEAVAYLETLLAEHLKND